MTMGKAPVKIDMRGFQAKVKEMALIVPKYTKPILKDEMARLLQDLVKRSKPKDNNKVMGAKIEANALRIAKVVPGATNQIPRELFYRAWKKHLKIPIERRVAVTKQILGAFVKTQRSHRGWMAAGWIGEGNKFHVKAPKGVTRHEGRTHVTIKDSLLAFRITVDNLVTYANRNPIMQRIIAASMKRRSSAIVANIKRLQRTGKYKPRGG